MQFKNPALKSSEEVISKKLKDNLVLVGIKRFLRSRPLFRQKLDIFKYHTS